MCPHKCQTEFPNINSTQLDVKLSRVTERG